jgi:drug/metabolite transporter (DMT)-like permease
VSVILGLLAVVFGIVIASVVDEPKPSGTKKLHPALGVGWALLSAVCFGWVLSVLGPRSAVLGPAWTIAILRVVGIALLLVLAKPLGWRLMGALRSEPATPASRGRTFVVACLDSGGMVFVAWGSSRGTLPGESAVVAVLASSFPLITIALARVYLREGLRWWQWIGVAIVIAAVGWVSARY